MTFWQKVSIAFKRIFVFFEPTLREFATSAGEAVLKSAQQAVIATAAYALDNDEDKRRTAYNQIVENLKISGVSVGVEVSTSMINRALELALAKAKADGKI